MKTNLHSCLKGLFCILFIGIGLFFIGSCSEDEMMQDQESEKITARQLDIGIETLWNISTTDVNVTPRSHGYVATAKGHGIIPSGEYAGQRFNIKISGVYSGIGRETLVSGEAEVRIRRERFISVVGPQSFCCGEGYLTDTGGGEWVFTMFGQVRHTTASEPHNHLFAGLANTTGKMNMNIEDQSGTIVDPTDPPHDPGIGLIIGFHANKVKVELHP